MRQHLRLCLGLLTLTGLQAKEAVGPTAAFALDRIVNVATAEYGNQDASREKPIPER